MILPVLLALVSAPTYIMTQFDEPVSPVVESVMRAEVESVLYPMQWRNPNSEPASHIVQVHLFGSCSGAGSESAYIRDLGWTHRSAMDHGHAEVIPFSGVDCDAIRSLIGQQPDETYGRALGRVVAHELYHALTRTDTHGKALMKSCFSPKDLLKDRLELAEKNRRVIDRLAG